MAYNMNFCVGATTETISTQIENKFNGIANVQWRCNLEKRIESKYSEWFWMLQAA